MPASTSPSRADESGARTTIAFVEQKNWSIARRLVGYDRYDTAAPGEHLKRLYELYRLYVNLFLPVTKLVRKERDGSRVRKVLTLPRRPTSGCSTPRT